MESSHSRILLLDLIKGIAILLMIIGHCIQYGLGIEYAKNHLFFDNLVFKFIYSFHMPLFALISGFLMYSSLNRVIAPVFYPIGDKSFQEWQNSYSLKDVILKKKQNYYCQ